MVDTTWRNIFTVYCMLCFIDQGEFCLPVIFRRCSCEIPQHSLKVADNMVWRCLLPLVFSVKADNGTKSCLYSDFEGQHLMIWTMLLESSWEWGASKDKATRGRGRREAPMRNHCFCLSILRSALSLGFGQSDSLLYSKHIDQLLSLFWNLLVLSSLSKQTATYCAEQCPFWG